MNLVQIERTSSIEQLLENALGKMENKNSNDYKQIENVLHSKSTKYIPASILVDAYKLSDKDKYLHEILTGCDLFVPAYAEPERNPELNERVERLKAQQANREYDEMTKNVNFNRLYSKKSTDSFIPDMKSMQGQLITIANVFLTIGGAFVFGYKVIEYSTGTENFVLQISFGLFCAFIVAVADLYFLFKRLNKIE
jgi:predicted RND superfamily exporter protein